MRELALTGHRSVIITSDANHLAAVPKLHEPSLTQQRDGLLMVWVRTFKAPAAKSLGRILSWLHFEWRLFRLDRTALPPPDVIVVSSLSLLTVINGLILRRRYGARLVFEVRDIWPLTLTEEGGYSRLSPWVILLGVIERIGYRRADEIVGTMPNLGEHVEAVIGQAREVHCIPMGYSERVASDVDELPPGYLAQHLPADGFTICYAGTVGITNALDWFFKAAEAMVDDRDVRFVLLGEGPMLGEYVERYSHLDNLTFAPRVPKGAVQQVLAECDLLYLAVHPSHVWAYGQSLNKLIDYMMAAKPIVASYTGFPSMINEAECGTLVEAGDIEALVRELRRYSHLSADERTAIGQRGRDWLLANRSYRKLAADYASILFPGTD
jgi:glycosyltransferase involved in cell wall biosynthesis